MSVKSEARVTLGDTRVHAKTVWAALKQKARNGTPTVYEGVAGRKVKVTLRDLMLSEIPVLRLLDHDDLERVYKEIRDCLRAGTNARCLENKKGTSPVWFVSNTYSDIQIVTVPLRHAGVGEGGRQDPRAEAEARLTPHEAGEDRTPEPIIIEKVKVTDDQKQHMAKILELLKTVDEPLAATEIAFVLEDLQQPHTPKKRTGSKGMIIPKSPVSGPKTNTALARLVGEGKIFRRLETSAERRIRADVPDGEFASGKCAYLHSRKDPVPERTVTEAVPGFRLQTGILPRDSGVVNGAKVREERNQRVLEALIHYRQPANITTLARVYNITRNKLEDGLKDLLAAGLVHHGPFLKGGRLWAPIDVPIQPATLPEPELPRVEPVTVSVISPDTEIHASERAILKALAEAGARGATSRELHEVTGYSTSHITTTFSRFNVPFKGSRNRCRVYYSPNARQEAPSMPTPTVVPPRVPVPAESDQLREAVAVLAAAHGLAANEDVAALKARIVELEEANAKLKRMLAIAQADL